MEGSLWASDPGPPAGSWVAWDSTRFMSVLCNIEWGEPRVITHPLLRWRDRESGSGPPGADLSSPSLSHQLRFLPSQLPEVWGKGRLFPPRNQLTGMLTRQRS